MNIEDNKEFEERADYISKDDLNNWTVENDFFNNIQKKILEKGAKLIVGPRGTGKTHQFRKAYFQCLRLKTAPLAIYISFGKYYRLEPLLFKSSNAINIFHAWVLSKIVLSAYDLLGSLDLSENTMLFSDKLPKDDIQNFIQTAERYNSIPEFDELIRFISIQKVIEILDDLRKTLNRKRTIILLDDAALTLTPDYMIEFFDIFRSLKTSHISPKASVYPGTTQYGPRFHIGQDAEEVSVWLNVDTDSYSDFMSQLLQKRFNDEIGISEDIVELLKYGAFGIPRAFIVLLRAYLDSKGNRVQQRFNNIINNQKNQLKDEYISLTLKLPQYTSILNIGYELFDKILTEIFNARDFESNEKKITIGIYIDEGQAYRENRMIKFLIEAGLLYETTEIHDGKDKDGKDKMVKRYIPHFLFLIQNRTFSSTKGFNTKDMLSNISKKTYKRPLRRSFSTLLLPEQLEKLNLNLPPCSKCGTMRLTEEQKFCHNCGNPLIGQSAFEACLKKQIDELPITNWLKDKIKKETPFNTIEDIFVSQSPVSELKKVKGIGKVKSDKFMKLVNSILDEFLS